jgi:phospholipase C
MTTLSSAAPKNPRRAALLLIAAAAFACSGGGDQNPADAPDAGRLAPPDPVDASLAETAPPADANADDGDATPPAGDAGKDAGPGDGMPIKYIVVIVKENHTFDNYFAGFPGADSSLTAKMSTGKVIPRPAAPKGGLLHDVSHSHASAMTAFRAGAMDGFDLVAGANYGTPPDEYTYIHYTESQLPNYWKLARTFVLADHFFSSTFGPSFPGHFAVTAGFNVSLDNPKCGCGGTCTVPVFDPKTCAISDAVPCWDAPSLIEELPKGFTWAEYGVSTWLSNKGVSQMPNVAANFRNRTQFNGDVRSPKQPNLMVLHVQGTVSEHPPAIGTGPLQMCPGENDSVDILTAIMNGPHWNETAVLLLWDDWGGFYDSVKPPAAKCPNGDYMTPGFRLPLLIISPFAKPGYVLKTETEQTSIVRLVEDLWHMPRMAPKDSRIHDDTVGSLMGAFDFHQAPIPPLSLPVRDCTGQP